MRLWETRYRSWLDAVVAGRIDATQLLMVDDGSPVLPGWPDTPVCSGSTLADAAPLVGRTGPALFHFTNHLGRPDMLEFPGWHRSFAFAVAYAEAADSIGLFISNPMRSWYPHGCAPMCGRAPGAGPRCGVKSTNFPKSPFR